MIKEGRRIAVDIDLSKFFDCVDHDLLMTHLSRKVTDKRLLKLIGRYLRAGIMDKQRFIESREGVPQGGPLSPLLANILLDSLDKELEKRGHKFARYADDFTILVKSLRAGERVLRSISYYLQNRLKLIVNTTKSRVVKTSQSKFLGFTFKTGRIQLHSNTLEAFKQRIRQLTNRNWGVSMHYQLFKLSQYLRGWINYFGIANCYQLCVDLDHWIRRRVRMAYWRQWRKPRTKVRNLMKRGVQVLAAVACGTTSKGPWRSSKSPALTKRCRMLILNPRVYTNFAMGGSSFTILSETPCADPHAGCCGSWRLETSGSPIIRYLHNLRDVEIRPEADFTGFYSDPSHLKLINFLGSDV